MIYLVYLFAGIGAVAFAIAVGAIFAVLGESKAAREYRDAKLREWDNPDGK